MAKLRITLTVALFVVAMCAMAQSKSNVEVKGNVISVEFFTPKTVHVTKHPVGKTSKYKSLVVTAQPDASIKLKKSETGTALIVSSTELKVKVDKRTGLVSFSSKGVSVAEQSFGFEERQSGPDKGAYRVQTSFLLDKGEQLYGIGAMQNGQLSRRNTTVTMEQSNLEDYQHMVQSIKGWGIYWDNYSRTKYDQPKDKDVFTFDSEVGDGVDYYFMLGGSADGVIAEMRAISGQVPMFPLWTYGYWQSKERYKSSREVLDVLRGYRNSNVPLDGMIQDWQYWGSNYTWNAMEFIHDDFMDGNRMIDEVHKMNAHFMISIWASFGPKTKQYAELDKLGLLYDFQTWPQSGLSPWPPRMDYPSGVRVYDALSPKAREIYWNHLTRLFNAGTDAWWMDSTDPDYFNPQDSDYDHTAGDGTWRRYRNAFPLASVKGVYENQRKATSDKRVFIMTRSAFAGQQRYGSGLWSGDVTSTWDMLRKQVPLGLNYSLTGCPNFNTDIGGFFAGRYNTRGGGSAPRNPQYQELYVRWMQYALFCPVFRAHGTDCAREVWQFGKPGETIYDAIVSQIKFRYRLLPYLYSTAWQVTSNNGSYMRPLFADFAADKRTWQMDDEFMFGQSILAAPILEAQYTPENLDRSQPKDGKFDPKAMGGWSVKETAATAEGYPVVDFTTEKQTDVYLPKGALWYDFWTGRQYRGGQDITIPTTIDRAPMFVRAGSILPLGPEMQYVGEKQWDNLELRVYPGANGTFVLYEDEGDNYNYENGAYSTIEMKWDDRKRTLTLGARKGEYPGMLATRKFTVVFPNGKTFTVDYAGDKVELKATGI